MKPTTPRRPAKKTPPHESAPVLPATPAEEVNALLSQRLSLSEETCQSVLIEAQRIHDLLEIANAERERIFQEKLQLQLAGLAKDRLIASLQAQLNPPAPAEAA